jgi:hypothetical protein
MMPFQTTTVSQLRGTSYDSFGDPVDAGTVNQAGIPACLSETAQQVEDPATKTPRTIRTAKCMVPDWAAFLTTDQVLDETTGETYMVIDVIAPTTLVATAGVQTLLLRRVTATST